MATAEQIAGQAGLTAGTGGLSLPAQIGINLGGNLLSAFSNFFGGGPNRRRIRELEAFSKGLGSEKISNADVSRNVDSRQREITQAISPLAEKAARRVGLDSGIGQGFVLRGAFDKSTQISEQERARQFQNNESLRNLQANLKSLLAGI